MGEYLKIARKISSMSGSSKPEKRDIDNSEFNEKFRKKMFDIELRRVAQAYIPDKEKWKKHQEAGDRLDEIWLKSRKGNATSDEFLDVLNKWSIIYTGNQTIH